MRKIIETVLLCVVLTIAFCSKPASAEVTIVKDGKSLVPIIIFKDAPPYTKEATEELALYIEKISGAKPVVIEGKPDPIPESAIWVGYQPVMKGIFPKINFNFEHPEEITIAVNDKHLVIAGRDIWDPERMIIKAKSKTSNILAKHTNKSYI